MTRTDLACWIGSTDDALATSIWDIMLDVEALKYAKGYCKTLAVDDETLALDAIHEAGPHGEFMSSPHTFEHFRDELNMLAPEKSYLFDDDGRDYIHKAYDKGKEIIANATPYEIEENLASELDSIMATARKEIEK